MMSAEIFFCPKTRNNARIGLDRLKEVNRSDSVRNLIYVAYCRCRMHCYEKKSGHQMVPGLCFWSVCSRHYRDCWNLRNLTAIDVKSSLLLTPAPEKIAFKYYAATFQQYAIWWTFLAAKRFRWYKKIIDKCPPESECIKILRSHSGEQSMEKYIYSMRNRIVHKTREAIIPLTDNETWDKAIAGMLYFLKEI